MAFAGGWGWAEGVIEVGIYLSMYLSIYLSIYLSNVMLGNGSHM